MADKTVSYSVFEHNWSGSSWLMAIFEATPETDKQVKEEAIAHAKRILPEPRGWVSVCRTAHQSDIFKTKPQPSGEGV